jgi:sulfonate transport system substrate-binding protein
MKAVKIRTILGASVLVLGVLGSSLVATGAGASSTTKKKTTTTTVKTLNLSKVTLNIGDISNSIITSLLASGEIASIGGGLYNVQGYPFKLSFTQFIAGPEAFAGIVGGSIDFAYSADTPAIFSEEQGVKFKTVGVFVPALPGADFSIVLPKGSTITSVAQLKGLTISAQTGTINEYVALQALAAAGLSEKDVTIDNLTPTNAEAALASGAVQAAVLPEPYVTLEKAAGDPVLESGKGLVDGYGFYSASTAALNNPAKAQAIGDLLKVIGKTQQWSANNVANLSQDVATTDSLPLALATVLVNDSISSFVTINSTVINATQKEADAFYANGELETPVVAKNIFTTQYNSIIKPYVNS